jgi:hypothetical protein
VMRSGRGRPILGGMNTSGTTTELVRFIGRVFLDSGSRYEPGTDVTILGQVEKCYLVRFPKGEETYLHTDTVNRKEQS